jgi:hypothetical protein
MRRYENRSTLMTSNRPIEEWGKLLSDVPAAGAILDRLLHHAEVIAIIERSYWLQDSVNQDLFLKRNRSNRFTRAIRYELVAAPGTTRQVRKRFAIGRGIH